MRITNIQKKELSEIFRGHKLNMLDFDKSGQHKEFKLQYKYEYYSFSINIQRTEVYHLTIFPVSNMKGYSTSGSWEKAKKEFVFWIKKLEIELNTPTGWETFQSENFLNTEYSELEQKFSESEKELLRQSLKQLQEKIRQLELSEEAIKFIDKKIDDLASKINEFSKFDWKSLFLGTIPSLIMTLAIPPDVNGMIWEYIKMAFNSLKLNE